MTTVPLTPPRVRKRGTPLFLPPAGDFCQQRQKSPKTPLETAFQDFLTRVGYDFALTCPTRNRFSGFSRFKGSCLHSFPRCAVARRCPLPRWVPWCSTARVPADIPSRRTTLSARTHAPCRAGPMCPAAGDAFSGGARGPRPTGRYVEPRVGDGVLPWSAAEQMPLGYDVPSARQCRAARPPLGGGCRRSRLGERKPCGISPSASASRCHLPRRGRQGGSVSPCAAGHMGPALRQGTASRSFPSLRHFSS